MLTVAERRAIQATRNANARNLRFARAQEQRRRWMRLRDLRHTIAARTIQRWYRGRQRTVRRRIYRRLPLL